jgi:hypothetical protein
VKRIWSASHAVVLLWVVVLLTGCAAPAPLFQQLREQQVQRIDLLVEGNPFTYQTPLSADMAYGGIPAINILTAVASLAVMARQEAVNKTLVEAAREAGVNTDHRQAFQQELVRRFRERGIEVDVVPVPFAAPPLTDRASVGPDPKALAALTSDLPAMSLRLDFGSCGIGVIGPCIRYALQPVAPSAGTQRVVGHGGAERYTFQQPAQSTVVRRSIPFRGVVGTEPGPNRPPGQQVASFPDLETAKARIREFDAAFAALIPRAVDQLMAVLEQDRRR